MQGKRLVGVQGSHPSQGDVEGAGLLCRIWGTMQGDMAGGGWGCAWSLSPQRVHPSGPTTASPLLQMGCLVSARWARCRTDPTSRSPLQCSSASRMSCGILWHKVKGGAWWEESQRGGVRQHCLAALELTGVLLAQGLGWAEKGSRRFWEEWG